MANAAVLPAAAHEPRGDTHSGPRLYDKHIALLALVLRLAVVVFTIRTLPPHWFYAQATELGQLAQSVVHGQGLSSPFGGSTGPSAFLPPGYPLLAALLFRLFGVYSQAAAAALMTLQAVFGAITVFVLMRLAHRTFGRTTAITAGLLCALNPWLIAFAAMLWDTNLSALLMISLVWLAVTWTCTPTMRISFAAALTSALAIAVNPSLAPTCFALFAGCVFQQKKFLRHHACRSSLLLPAAVFLVLCSGWPVRNFQTMHGFIPLRSNMGYELWQGNRPGADGFFAKELHPNVNRAEFVRYQALGELGYIHEKSTEARQWVLGHPGRFFALTAKRFFCFWAGVGQTVFPGMVAMTTLVSLMAWAGVALLLRQRRWDTAALFASPLFLFPLPYYITHPDFRFWCLLAPLLTALASYAAVSLFRNAKLAERRWSLIAKTKTTCE